MAMKRKKTSKTTKRNKTKKGSPRGVPRPIKTRNMDTLTCRVQTQILAKEMTVGTDNSLSFSLLNAPWRPVSVTPQFDSAGNMTEPGYNRLYTADFVKLQTLYDKYQLSAVDYEIERPKAFLNATDTDFHDLTTVEWGTQVLHGEQIYQPDSVTGSIQGTSTLTPKVIHYFSTNWQACVDDSDKRFQLHGTKNRAVVSWRPQTPFEKQWRNILYSDNEIACGGLHLRIKSAYPIPVLDGASTPSYNGQQVMFTITARLTMKYMNRT